MSGRLRLPFQRRDLPVGLGEHLRSVRVGQGRTRHGVAKAARIGPRTLARIERGAQAPSYPTLERLCDALDVDMWTVARKWSEDSSRVPTDPSASPGLELRALRKEMRVTLVDLAARSGVSVSTLSRFERGLTISRRLSVRTGPETRVNERDVMLDVERLALALGFQNGEELRSACLAAASRGDLEARAGYDYLDRPSA